MDSKVYELRFRYQGETDPTVYKTYDKRDLTQLTRDYVALCSFDRAFDVRVVEVEECLSQGIS